MGSRLQIRCGCPFFLIALLSAFAPVIACADIYRWTDERGVTVISNVRPAKLDKARNVELVAKETEVQASSPGPRAPTNTEQILLDRIDRLERELRAQQYSQPVRAGPPPGYSGSYYAAPPPPPPPAYYNDSYYPSYYYPWPPVYSYGAYPARIVVSRPVHVFSHGGFVRGGSVHRGRR